ncbi:scarecrow-like protein 6 [Iris pallida]|uniref:Scarecrow-like protein 6 n=1 Tax=Iris pallida TaxID=29817 RepID=A0AAX6EKJ4_IRIPA|nr:scarecrow-like protein 6 [Iris pallida]
MREMHIPFLEVEATVEAARDYWNIDTDTATTLGPKEEAAAANSRGSKRKGELVVVGVEPRSVLDNRSSPSRSSSSLGFGGGGGSSDTAGVAAAVSDKWPPLDQRKEEWASELQPIIPHSSSFDIPLLPTANEWKEEKKEEAMLSDPAASMEQEQEQTFLRWIMGDDDCSNSPKQQQMFSLQESLTDFGGLLDTGFGFPASSPNQQVFLPPVPNSLPMSFQEPALQNPPPFFLPLPPQTDHAPISPPPPKRHNHHSVQLPFTPPNPAAIPFQLQQRPGKPKDEPTTAPAHHHQQQQQQALVVDQLLKAAELVETSAPLGAREILARLNHQLPASPHGLNPLLRSAVYFKESLLHLLSTRSSNSTPISNPWDVVLKLSACKAFSEASPFLNFANFTCTQTLLEQLADADRIHIVDFDIGVGGHWSSFMLELAHRRSPATPFLKITAFVSPSSLHPLELHLTRQSLSYFAAEHNIPFELNILSIESFDPNELLAASSPAEAVAVNLPVGCHYGVPFPTLLRLVKQLAPKVVVSVERGCDRSDLSFTHSFLHCFQSCMVLLDSIDAAGTCSDVAGKIERFLVQPWVEGVLTGRHRAVEKMHPWRMLLSSVGFVPVQFSNFTEAQAECLLRTVQVRGFHVEKRQASLFLYWQRGELGSVSAWRC